MSVLVENSVKLSTIYELNKIRKWLFSPWTIRFDRFELSNLFEKLEVRGQKVIQF